MSTQELPDALLKELPGGTGHGYSARDLIMAYMANKGDPCSTRELMVYVYKASGVVMKRTYFYQLMYKLRKADIVGQGELTSGSEKTWSITLFGDGEARPYLPVKGE